MTDQTTGFIRDENGNEQEIVVDIVDTWEEPKKPTKKPKFTSYIREQTQQKKNTSFDSKGLAGRLATKNNPLNKLRAFRNMKWK